MKLFPLSLLALCLLFMPACRQGSCIIDPVENFTWESRVDIVTTEEAFPEIHEEFGDLRFVFLYQDAEMQGFASEILMMESILYGVRRYQATPGGGFNPDDSNRNWVIYIATTDPTDPLWNDLCTQPSGGCSCTFGNLFPAVVSDDENQMVLSGATFYVHPLMAVCHESMHIVQGHWAGTLDISHESYDLFHYCWYLELWYPDP